jgi:ubiquinone/menaquinone biosynthesis C-methylase UbiE
MAKAGWIARQSAHPSGWIGHIVARVMAWDTSRVNDRTLEALDVRPGEEILEVGCGHGRSLARLYAQEPGARLVGVDPSEVMLREARRRNRRSIEAGRVQIELGESSELPFPSARFDAVFSVHTLYFWPDLGGGLRELARVLRPGGRLLLVYRPESPELREELPTSVYRLRSTKELEAALAEAGCVEVETRTEGQAKSELAFTFARTAVR